jgi:hypothetical protein
MFVNCYIYLFTFPLFLRLIVDIYLHYYICICLNVIMRSMNEYIMYCEEYLQYG